MTSTDKKRKTNERMSKRIMLYVIVFMIGFLLLVTAVAPKRYNYNVGEIATTDIKAPRDTVDEVSTEEKRKEAEAKVEKQFSLKSEVKIEIQEEIKKLFSKVASEKSNSNTEEAKKNVIKENGYFELTVDEIKVLLQQETKSLSEAEVVLNDVIDKVYDNNIPDKVTEEMKKELQGIADETINETKLTNELKNIMRKISYGKIKQNFFYDEAKYQAKVNEVRKNTPREMIKKNQIIVRAGEPITERQLNLLVELGLLNKTNKNTHIYLYLVLAVYVGLIMFIQQYYLYIDKRYIYDDLKMVALVCMINLLTLILATGINIISPFLIPLACAPILLSLLVDYKVSLIMSSLNILLIGVIVGFNSSILIIAVVNTIIGAIILKKLQQRNDILLSAISIGIISSIITLLVGVITTNDFRVVIGDVGFTALGSILSGILAVGILPFLETGFDVVTNVKLLELSNPNNPLLRRLLMEAPGTYHHSMMVANLAEVAAEEVGGNPVVARIGAYYHDVGKIKRPYFFAENQMGKDNPHNKITANLSTLIIISHTKDGLELAKEYGMPKVIQDMIIQHHGNTLVKYFYYAMKKVAERPEDIKEEDFRYPGPKPTSKEAGILMLADSVEAAVRSISDPTKGKIEEMVNNIIKDKLNDDQLVECDLTLKDLETIRKCFLRVLNGIYHQRIEYPTGKLKIK